VAATGRYHLVNKGTQPIAELHVQMDPNAKLDRLEFAPAELTLDDKQLGYRIYS
jgi:hypothetical protein